jgi:tetratricopeptide (TPR) repeat protein
LPAGLLGLPFSLRGDVSTSLTDRHDFDGAGVAAPDFYLRPAYRKPRELDAMLAKVPAGSDEFISEKWAEQVAAVLNAWSAQLLFEPGKTDAIEHAFSKDFVAASPAPISEQVIRADGPLRVRRLAFSQEMKLVDAKFLAEWRHEVSTFSRIVTAEFQVTSLLGTGGTAAAPAALETRVRFELVGSGEEYFRESRVGYWAMEWEIDANGDVHLRRLATVEETRSRSVERLFEDIASQAFAGCTSFEKQLRPGTDYWRTVLDGASGIDIYGHSGVALGDIDGDGFDDLYVCQPAGLPNRLYRNRDDGTFEDITDGSGVGLLENTACALFADVDNDGRQELIVVRAAGPLLFLNEGGGRFREKANAFRFATPPQGTFTGAAIADYDRDGWLDIYFCLYSFYQGADQYRYPCPYFDAENGPPNFLMRNGRDGSFHDVTKESGLSVNNTRFSFCCGWGEAGEGHGPDLYVVNDFGRKNLYRNNGDGTFTDIAPRAGVEDVGAGMSVSWMDYENTGKNDLYVANMWTAAGTRLTEQATFQKSAVDETRALYRKHAMGNSLFRNEGAGKFTNETSKSRTGMGRWAWSSDAWDFDQDGLTDLYVTNGMVTGTLRTDLNSFFWRQVVANSPQTSHPSHVYEQGWNAINELIRADSTWSGFERNVLYLNNGDGTFSDVSGAAGLDFIEDARTFALGDLDGDGRVEAVLKNRSEPQLRLLKNTMSDVGAGVAIRLRGTKSNRDAVGAAVTVASGNGLKQTRFVQAGTGYLAQHSKELFFGLGKARGTVKVSVRWPSGARQDLGELPVGHRVWVEEEHGVTKTEVFRKAPLPTDFTKSAEHARVGLPEAVETWLLAPVTVPEILAEGETGNMGRLASLRGKRVLLYFSTAASPVCREELGKLRSLEKQWIHAGLELLVVSTDKNGANIDGSAVKANAESLAIYNILFRSLFDRHRDMPLPIAMLIDEIGAIVKVYQGRIPTDGVERDAASIPKNDAERIAKALPFRGVSARYEFGRNYLSYGSVFFERGYLGQAEVFFKLALDEDPQSAEAYYGLGSVYLEQQNPVPARASFQKAVQLKASYPGTTSRAWNNLGILDARQMRTDDAIANFKRALEIDSAYIVALDNLGNAYRQAKKSKEAAQTFSRAIELDPDDAEANYGLGILNAQEGHEANALEYLQRALKTRPNYPEALNNLGVLYLHMDRPADAEKSFLETIRVAPEFAQAYFNVARLYALQGDKAKARGVLQSYLKIKPGDAAAEKALQELGE